eukprot:EG_transcript_12340
MAPKKETDIFKIVQKGDPDVVSDALKQNRSLANERNKKQQTPLHLACENGDVGCAEVLLEFGAALEAHDQEGRTPLHLAVQRNYDDLIPALLAHGADPALVDSSGLNAVHWAARMGYAEIAHCLLEPVEAAQGKKKEGKGPVEVNAPALLQARDKENNTPVHLAASEPESQALAVQFLDTLSKNAPGAVKEVLQLKNKAGFTLLHLACSAGSAELMRRLADLGADLLATTPSQETVLHLCIQSGDLPLLDSLLKLEATIGDQWKTLLNRPDNAGNTPLHLACAAGNTKTLAKLLQHKDNLDFEARNKSGCTAVAVAYKARHTAAVELLKGHGAKLDEAALAKEAEAPAAAPAARGDYSGMSKVGAVEAKPTKKPEKAPEEAASGFNPLILVLLLALFFFVAFYFMFVK